MNQEVVFNEVLVQRFCVVLLKERVCRGKVECVGVEHARGGERLHVVFWLVAPLEASSAEHRAPPLRCTSARAYEVARREN